MIHTTRTQLENEDFGWLVGRSLSSLRFAEPGSWWFDFASGGQIATHGGVWRLLASDELVATSADHGHLFGLPAPVDAVHEATTAMRNAHVIAARIRDGAPDLEVRLSNGLTLEVLVFSSGYECWETTDPSGRCVVVSGRRDASTWQRESRSSHS